MKVRRRSGLVAVVGLAVLGGVATGSGLASAAGLPAPPPPATARPTFPEGWVSGTAGQNSWLASISCSPDFFCVAVGTAGDEATSGPPLIPLVAYFDGARWTIDPDRSDQNALLTSVSCAPTGRSFCLALGLGSSGPSAQILDGVRWRPAAAMVRVGSDDEDEFDGSACTSDHGCLAAGSSYNGVHSSPLLESWDGKRWRVDRLPAVSGDASLESVACRSATSCVAVGAAPNAAGTYHPLAFAWNGSVWQTAAPHDPSRFTSDFANVSCTPARCTAVGPAGADAVTETWSGGGWSSPSRYSLARTVLNPTAISCGSGSCVVVGAATAQAGDRTFGAVERRGHWMALDTSRYPLGIGALTCTEKPDVCAVVGGGLPTADLTGAQPAQAGIVSP
jgi:hypothetical protein